MILGGDCLVLMDEIPDHSVDMIICDLPYGMTQNKWDSPIDLELLWRHYDRIVKDNGAVVLFGAGKFSARLIVSNIKNYRYTLIWQKTTPTGFLNAKKQPLRTHEDILVFYNKQPTYNPQMTYGHKPVNSYTKHTGDGTNYGTTKQGISGGGNTSRYPTSVIKVATDKQKNHYHPTQKPVALLEWLIATYTNPGEVVLDNCAGSGSTAIAAKNLNREYIAIESDSHYVEAIKKRLGEE